MIQTKNKRPRIDQEAARRATRRANCARQVLPQSSEPPRQGGDAARTRAKLARQSAATRSGRRLLRYAAAAPQTMLSPKIIALEEGWNNEIKAKAIDVLASA